MVRETIMCELDGCQGELERIAETRKEHCNDGSSYAPGARPFFEKTGYFKCLTCAEIFEKHSKYEGTEEFKKTYRKYEGPLTEDEILECAPRCHGKIPVWKEKEIIAKRKT